VGFCDQAALNRHFKQVVGLSPAAYRRWATGRDPGPSGGSRRDGA